MKWKTYWWGVEFHSETLEDEILLRTLIARLPKKPFESYEGGGIEVTEPTNPSESLILTFER